MLVDTAKRVEPQGQQDTDDDARVLSLAESVGNMGHWCWQIVSDRMTWSDQVHLIFGHDPVTYKPEFESFLEQFHSSDRHRVESHLREAIAQRAPFEFDARIVTPDSIVRNIIAKGQPEVSSDGEVTAMFGVVTDVTDAFQTLQAIRDQKEMLDLAAGMAGIGHWVWDPDNRRIVYCSDNLISMFGASEQEVVRAIVHPSEFSRYICYEDSVAYAETVRRQVSTAESYETEYRCNVSGDVHFFREVGRPIISDDGELQRYIATVQDITKRVKREQELENAKRELESVVGAKDQLFSIIGHDLKEPFNQVIGFASLLQANSDSLTPEKVQGYSALIVEAAQDTSQLLDKLLHLAASESDMLPLKVVDFDLASLTQDAMRPARGLADAKSLSIDAQIQDVYVSADRDMVETVLRNLINNAVKFCETGDRITIYAAADESDASRVCVKVADTGVGMDASQLVALDSPSRLLPATGNGSNSGAGLGLHLCRNLIRRHGGTLRVESSPGNGCTIRFTLPAKTPA